MAEIICIIGTKGGSGKTSLSHMLCHGLCLLDRKAACVTTDIGRETLNPKNRNYVLADARTPQAREKVVATLRGLKGWIGVIDGGANRTPTDMLVYEVSNLVLLPFRDSAEDLRVVVRDLERFPRAYALPSQWPNNPWQLEAAQRLLETLPFELRSRVVDPTYSISASKLLLQTTPPALLPTPLNNACRALANQTLHLLDAKGQGMASSHYDQRELRRQGQARP